MYDNKKVHRLEKARVQHAPDAAGWVAENLGIVPEPQQVRVLATDCRRGILNCSRQWGKSTIAAAKAVHQAACHAGSLTIVVSPSARQSAELVMKAREFVGRLGIRPKGDGSNEISLLFPNGSRIIGLPGTEATIRGFSAVALLLVDEASRVEDELYHAIRPMLAVSNGALWLMSTPNGKSGFFYDTWTRGPGEWERISVPATDCSRIPTRHLDEERLVLGERGFRQEYMCEFGDTEAGVFDLAMVERCISHDFAPMVIH